MINIAGAVLRSLRAPLNLMIHWYGSIGLRRAVSTMFITMKGYMLEFVKTKVH